MQNVSFWDAFGNDIKQSEVKALIAKNASFESICEQPTFIDEFLSLNEYVINYLSSDEIIDKLVTYLVDMTDYNASQYTKKCHFSYFAFTILSTCNTKVHDKLLSKPVSLLKLFSVAQEDPDIYITSQGYLAALVKNWVSPQNSKADLFFRFLADNFQVAVLPIVHNLSTSNAEIIKEVLTCRSDLLEKQQNSLFHYLIYFYLTEKFDANFLERNPDSFGNLFGIFKFLAAVHVTFPYNSKFIPRLYKNLDIRKVFLRDDLLSLRVVLLRYLAQTSQINALEPSVQFLAIYKSITIPAKKIFLLSTFLETCVFLSKNSQNFVALNFQRTFLMFLFDIISANKVIEIIVNKVFVVLENSLPWILGNPDHKNFLLQFIYHQIVLQNELRLNSHLLNSPYISMHFMARLIFKIEPVQVEDTHNGLNDWRLKLQMLYTKLAFENLDQQSIMAKKNAVRFDINQDIEFFSAGKEDSHVFDDTNQIHTPEKLGTPSSSVKPANESGHNHNSQTNKFKNAFDFSANKTFILPISAPLNDPFALFR